METLASKQVYSNRCWSVREDTVQRHDGSTGTSWVLESAHIVLLVPLDDDRMHLVEQYRHPVGKRCWEFPSGTLDANVDAGLVATAKRELREETGLVATTIERLGTIDVMPSTLSQRCSVYLATGLTEGEPQRELEELDMRSAWFSRAEVEQMIGEGAISEAKSLAAYTLLQTRP